MRGSATRMSGADTASGSDHAERRVAVGNRDVASVQGTKGLVKRRAPGGNPKSALWKLVELTGSTCIGRIRCEQCVCAVNLHEANRSGTRQTGRGLSRAGDSNKQSNTGGEHSRLTFGWASR
jgi:hypothetical protein